MERKKSIVFWSTAFGIPVLLGILMAVVFYAGNATGIFPVAWMFVPAAGVLLGLLLTRREGQVKLPKAFIFTFLATTVAMIALCFFPFFMDGNDVAVIGNVVFMIASVISLITLIAAGKKKRKAYGLNVPNIGKGILIVVLFVALYFGITYGSVLTEAFIAGEKVAFKDLLMNRDQTLSFISLPLMFFLTFLPYFGEEYGWRYYLLPRLMKKFGARAAMVMLGVIWGLWHLPINMFFYSPETAFKSILMQCVGCVCFAVFFAWAYMKTNGNIWVVTAIHFFNNNIGGVLTNSDGSGSVLSWRSVAIASVFYIGLLVVPFIFSKTFSKENAEKFATKMIETSEMVEA